MESPVATQRNLLQKHVSTYYNTLARQDRAERHERFQGKLQPGSSSSAAPATAMDSLAEQRKLAEERHSPLLTRERSRLRAARRATRMCVRTGHPERCVRLIPLAARPLGPELHALTGDTAAYDRLPLD